MTDDATPAKVRLTDGLGAVDELRREFEAWACVRDYDTTHSMLNPLRYANERTQGAWQAWGHAAANWRDMRDRAIDLLRIGLAALEHHREQTRPIHDSDEAIAAIRRGLGLCVKCGLRPGCPDCRALHDVPEGA